MRPQPHDVILPTIASICTGGGLADIGAMQAGYQPIWGIEIDPQIAQTAQLNLGHPVTAKSVTEIDPATLERPDLLWASPPCQSFSVAKANGKESSADVQIARSIVDFLKTLTPPVFILENVEAYKRSNSLKFIEGALYALGYWVDRQVINSADYGVPQTRRRLILRAVRGGFVPPLPTPQAWRGWYQAIEDLIPTLEETQFAAWQIERLPAEMTSTSLVDVQNTIRSCTVRGLNSPSFTVLANAMRRPMSVPRAFILDSKNCRDREGATNGLTLRSADELLFTLVSSSSGHLPKAFVVDGTAKSKQQVTVRSAGDPIFTTTATGDKAWLEQGRVVKMSVQALGRFQTLPDWYQGASCKIIGNGVPCELARQLCLGMKEVYSAPSSAEETSIVQGGED